MLLTREGPKMATNDIRWTRLIAITLIGLGQRATVFITHIVRDELEKPVALVPEVGIPVQVHLGALTPEQGKRVH